jgi:hypothetical protein
MTERNTPPSSNPNTEKLANVYDRHRPEQRDFRRVR